MTQVLSLPKEITKRQFETSQYLENEEYKNCLRSISWVKVCDISDDEGYLRSFLNKGELAELIQEGRINRLPGWSCTFVNGSFEPLLSNIPEGCLLLSMKEARGFYQSFFQLHKEGLTNIKSPVHCLNASFLDEAAFLYIPEEHVIKDPIIIRNIVLETPSNNKKSIALPAVTVALSTKASAALNVLPVEIFLGRGKVLSGSNSIISGVLNIVADRLSVVDLYFGSEIYSTNILGSFEVCLANESSQIWSVSALMQERSSILTYVCSRENNFSSGVLDCRYQLLGSRAYAEVLGSVKDPKKLFLKVAMLHKAAETGSRQTIKSLLREGSSFSFEGDIVIDPDCEASEAYQKHDSLLLEESASVVTIPRLQIFTDNVKASHGATVGKPDESVIFFMRSRGISEDRAKEVFLEGFLHPKPEGACFD
ncbi:SufD family Fe-S cluster assembly protein [Chlamydiifrater volucris]|uniref:SufD family Fe-S cluster assembly protein n=1 Tax=Chlamydiifrater volucris TaxID=2681470 RepID=UPI001BCB7930|nr:SufD family Fe-S cluster assembly protein [Chlamydiifrater volucris]